MRRYALCRAIQVLVPVPKQSPFAAVVSEKSPYKTSS